jgi:hypothetical protein
MYEELDLRDRQRHQSVRRHAGYLLKRADTTPEQVIEELSREYAFDHIGKGRFLGVDTIHFTLAGRGAPMIVYPPPLGRDTPGTPDGADPASSSLYALCASGIGLRWPPPGHSPMDTPDQALLASQDFCARKLPAPGPDPEHVDDAMAARQDEIVARARHLLDHARFRPARVIKELRAEYRGFEFLERGFGPLPGTVIRFRLQGGSTQEVASPTWLTDHAIARDSFGTTNRGTSP